MKSGGQVSLNFWEITSYSGNGQRITWANLDFLKQATNSRIRISTIGSTVTHSTSSPLLIETFDLGKPAKLCCLILFIFSEEYMLVNKFRTTSVKFHFTRQPLTYLNTFFNKVAFVDQFSWLVNNAHFFIEAFPSLLVFSGKLSRFEFIHQLWLMSIVAYGKLSPMVTFRLWEVVAYCKLSLMASYCSAICYYRSIYSFFVIQKIHAYVCLPITWWEHIKSFWYGFSDKKRKLSGHNRMLRSSRVYDNEKVGVVIKETSVLQIKILRKWINNIFVIANSYKTSIWIFERLLEIWENLTCCAYQAFGKISWWWRGLTHGLVARFMVRSSQTP